MKQTRIDTATSLNGNAMRGSSNKSVQSVKRALLARIQSAYSELRNKKSIDDRAIHSARKHLKGARAGLRLLRGIAGKRNCAAENVRLRNAARLLSGVRDAKVLLDVATALMRCEKNARDRESLSELVRELKTQRAQLKDQMVQENVKKCCSMLAQSKRAIARWPVKGQGEALTISLGRLCRKSRKAAKRARHSRTDDDLHEARKQVKYLSLALKMLAASGAPGVTDAHQSEAAMRRSEIVADCLGEDRDLALVLGRLSALSKGAEVAGKKRFAKIHSQRKKLQREAFQQAKHLRA